MSAHQNVSVVRRYFEEGMNRGNIDLIDELVAPQYIEHGTALTQVTGRENLKRAIQQLRSSMPDLRFTINAIIARGDTVEVFTTSEATVSSANANSIGKPGQRLRIAERRKLRVVDGLITEHCEQQVSRVEIWDARRGWQPFTDTVAAPHTKYGKPALH